MPSDSKPHDPNALGWGLLLVMGLVQAIARCLAAVRREVVDDV